MDEQSLEQFGGVLAAPPRRPWRRFAAPAMTAALAAATLAGLAAILAQHSASAPTPFATLTDPGGPQHVQDVWSVAFTPDGKTLAAGDGDGSMYLWSMAIARRKAVLAAPHAVLAASHGSMGVSSVAFSPDGRMLAGATTTAAPPCGMSPPANGSPRSPFPTTVACSRPRSALTAAWWPRAPVLAPSTGGTSPREKGSPP